MTLLVIAPAVTEAMQQATGRLITMALVALALIIAADHFWPAKK
jgi:hypothetical protein